MTDNASPPKWSEYCAICDAPAAHVVVLSGRCSGAIRKTFGACQRHQQVVEAFVRGLVERYDKSGVIEVESVLATTAEVGPS